MGSGSLACPGVGEAQDRFSRLGGLATPCGADGKSSGLGVQPPDTPVQCCVVMVGDPSFDPKLGVVNAAQDVSGLRLVLLV